MSFLSIFSSIGDKISVSWHTFWLQVRPSSYTVDDKMTNARKHVDLAKFTLKDRYARADLDYTNITELLEIVCKSEAKNNTRDNKFWGKLQAQMNPGKKEEKRFPSYAQLANSKENAERLFDCGLLDFKIPTFQLAQSCQPLVMDAATKVRLANLSDKIANAIYFNKGYSGVEQKEAIKLANIQYNLTMAERAEIVREKYPTIAADNVSAPIAEGNAPASVAAVNSVEPIVAVAPLAVVAGNANAAGSQKSCWDRLLTDKFLPENADAGYTQAVADKDRTIALATSQIATLKQDSLASNNNGRNQLTNSEKKASEQAEITKQARIKEQEDIISAAIVKLNNYVLPANSEGRKIAQLNACLYILEHSPNSVEFLVTRAKEITQDLINNQTFRTAFFKFIFSNENSAKLLRPSTINLLNTYLEKINSLPQNQQNQDSNNCILDTLTLNDLFTLFSIDRNQQQFIDNLWNYIVALLSKNNPAAFNRFISSVDIALLATFLATINNSQQIFSFITNFMANMPNEKCKDLLSALGPVWVADILFKNHTDAGVLNFLSNLENNSQNPAEKLVPAEKFDVIISTLFDPLQFSAAHQLTLFEQCTTSGEVFLLKKYLDFAGNPFQTSNTALAKAILNKPKFAETLGVTAVNISSSTLMEIAIADPDFARTHSRAVAYAVATDKNAALSLSQNAKSHLTDQLKEHLVVADFSFTSPKEADNFFKDLLRKSYIVVKIEFNPENQAEQTELAKFLKCDPTKLQNCLMVFENNKWKTAFKEVLEKRKISIKTWHEKSFHSFDKNYYDTNKITAIETLPLNVVFPLRDPELFYAISTHFTEVELHTENDLTLALGESQNIIRKTIALGTKIANRILNLFDKNTVTGFLAKTFFKSGTESNSPDSPPAEETDRNQPEKSPADLESAQPPASPASTTTQGGRLPATPASPLSPSTGASQSPGNSKGSTLSIPEKVTVKQLKEWFDKNKDHKDASSVAISSLNTLIEYQSEHVATSVSDLIGFLKMLPDQMLTAFFSSLTTNKSGGKLLNLIWAGKSSGLIGTRTNGYELLLHSAQSNGQFAGQLLCCLTDNELIEFIKDYKKYLERCTPDKISQLLSVNLNNTQALQLIIDFMRKKNKPIDLTDTLATTLSQHPERARKIVTREQIINSTILCNKARSDINTAIELFSKDDSAPEFDDFILQLSDQELKIVLTACWMNNDIQKRDKVISFMVANKKKLVLSPNEDHALAIKLLNNLSIARKLLPEHNVIHSFNNFKPDFFEQYASKLTKAAVEDINEDTETLFAKVDVRKQVDPLLETPLFTIQQECKSVDDLKAMFNNDVIQHSPFSIARLIIKSDSEDSKQDTLEKIAAVLHCKTDEVENLPLLLSNTTLRDELLSRLKEKGLTLGNDFKFAEVFRHFPYNSSAGQSTIDAENPEQTYTHIITGNDPISQLVKNNKCTFLVPVPDIRGLAFLNRNKQRLGDDNFRSLLKSRSGMVRNLLMSVFRLSKHIFESTFSRFTCDSTGTETLSAINIEECDIKPVSDFLMTGKQMNFGSTKQIIDENEITKEAATARGRKAAIALTAGDAIELFIQDQQYQHRISPLVILQILNNFLTVKSNNLETDKHYITWFLQHSPIKPSPIDIYNLALAFKESCVQCPETEVDKYRKVYKESLEIVMNCKELQTSLEPNQLGEIINEYLSLPDIQHHFDVLGMKFESSITCKQIEAVFNECSNLVNASEVNDDQANEAALKVNAAKKLVEIYTLKESISKKPVASTSGQLPKMRDVQRQTLMPPPAPGGAAAAPSGDAAPHVIMSSHRAKAAPTSPRP